MHAYRWLKYRYFTIFEYYKVDLFNISIYNLYIHNLVVVLKRSYIRQDIQVTHFIYIVVPKAGLLFIDVDILNYLHH